MLVIDFPLAGGGFERVGVVGSCRVHDPLKEMVRQGRGAFKWSAFNTFTHTPAEARQHLAFCRGRLDIPEPFAPFIFRQDKVPLLDRRLPDLVESCTTFLVEMSGLRYLRCGYYVFNQDYFAQQFVRGLGPGMLPWHRGLSAEAPAAETVSAARTAMTQGGRPVGVAAEEILACLRSLALTPESYGAELAALVHNRAKRWIFVPHFNISEDPARRIARRAALAELLAREARIQGHDFYDPTPLVAEADPAQALEGEGADSYHYAPGFLARVGERLYDVIMEAASSRGRGATG